MILQIDKDVLEKWADKNDKTCDEGQCDNNCGISYNNFLITLLLKKQTNEIENLTNKICPPDYLNIQNRKFFTEKIDLNLWPRKIGS